MSLGFAVATKTKIFIVFVILTIDYKISLLIQNWFDYKNYEINSFCIVLFVKSKKHL